MIVRTGPRETNEIVGAPVASRQGLHVGLDLHLGDAVGELEGPVQPNGVGDPVEQLVHARQADGLEHLVDVVVRVRREPHAGR